MSDRASNSTNAFRGIAAASLGALLLVATRWPLAAQHLFSFDTANFALALDNFNPGLHQPQPPGYPLFVGLARLIHLFVADAQQVFLIAGLVAAWTSLLLIRALGQRMFGPTAGLIAAALLFANPALWLGGITNPVRVFLALGSLGTGMLAWRTLEEDAHPAWFYGCFAWLGIAAGFRPVESVLLFPLLLWIWARSGRSAGQLVLAILACCITTAPWLIVTVSAIGGVPNAITLVWTYAHAQFQDTSRLFGAGDNAALEMLEEAFVWNGLGAVAWLWALPLSIVRKAFAEWGVRTRFLLIWFLPPFLFSALVHIGDPDHALTTIPVLCLVGGAVLATLVKNRDPRSAWLVAGAAAVSCSLLFMFPLPGRVARASTYRAIAAAGRITDGALFTIEEMRRPGKALILHYGFPVSFRQISYYFPDDYVVVLPRILQNPSSTGTVWVFFHRKLVAEFQPGSEIVLPDASKILLLLPQGLHPLQVAPDLPFPGKRGCIFFVTRLPQHPFRLGTYQLTIGLPPYANDSGRSASSTQGIPR